MVKTGKKKKMKVAKQYQEKRRKSLRGNPQQKETEPVNGRWKGHPKIPPSSAYPAAK
jgi:hypothetical protein